MILDEINTAIKELEADEFSVFNVKKLASLYIVRDNIKKSVRNAVRASESNSDESEHELQDIFPAYHKYKEIKTRYQLHEISEEALIPAMKLVAQELEEFISSLYNNTYSRKERICLESVISNLHKRFELS